MNESGRILVVRLLVSDFNNIMTTTVHDIDVIFPDAKELLSTLQSIKPDGKVTADFTFSEGGVSVHWINKAKNFQSSIFLGKNVRCCCSLQDSLFVGVVIVGGVIRSR